MAQLTDIIIDSLAPPALARLWAQVLDGYAVRPYGPEDIEQLAVIGRSPDTDPAVALDGPGPTLFFQETSIPKTERNRVHLDVRADDRTTEVARLVALGARVRDTHGSFTVMLDPEGNEFCVVDRHPRSSDG